MHRWAGAGELPNLIICNCWNLRVFLLGNSDTWRHKAPFLITGRCSERAPAGDRGGTEAPGGGKGEQSDREGWPAAASFPEFTVAFVYCFSSCKEENNRPHHFKCFLFFSPLFFFFLDGGITQLPHHDFWRLPHTLCVELTSLPKWGELRSRQAGQGSGCFAGWGQTGQERKLSFGSSLQENKYQIRERRPAWAQI